MHKHACLGFELCFKQEIQCLKLFYLMFNEILLKKKSFEDTFSVVENAYSMAREKCL